jgi:hypothetical protein
MRPQPAELLIVTQSRKQLAKIGHYFFYILALQSLAIIFGGFAYQIVALAQRKGKTGAG